MRLTLIALGDCGCRLSQVAMAACMSGLWDMDALQMILVGADATQAQEMERKWQAYARVRGAYGLSPHTGFVPAVTGMVWEEDWDAVNLLSACEGEEDECLARALFPREVLRVHGMHADPSHGQIHMMQAFSRGFDGRLDAVRDTLTARKDTAVLLCGSLCENITLAGAGLIARYLREQCASVTLLSVWMGPVFQNESGVRSAQALRTLPETLDACYVIGLPEDLRMDRGEGSIADLAWLGCATEIVGGKRGAGSFLTRVGWPSWDFFGEAAVRAQECLESFLRASALILSDIGPAAEELLEGKDSLLQQKPFWYAPFFGKKRKQDMDGRQRQRAWMHDLMMLMKSYVAVLHASQVAMPYIMQRAEVLEQSVRDCRAHYSQVLDIAGRVALLAYDVEQSGIAGEEIVHRGSVQETEGEQSMRFLEEARQALETAVEEQEKQNREAGGRAILQMLEGFAMDAEAEAKQVRDEYEEAKRRIAEAAMQITEEEQEKIDQARSRLMRMRRHLAMLEGRARQVQEDESRARMLRRAMPEFRNTVQETRTLFFPPQVADILCSDVRLDRKGRRRAQEMLESEWPHGHLTSLREQLRKQIPPEGEGGTALLEAVLQAAKQEGRE